MKYKQKEALKYFEWMPDSVENWHCPTCNGIFREEDLIEIPPSKCPTCGKEARPHLVYEPSAFTLSICSRWSDEEIDAS